MIIVSQEAAMNERCCFQYFGRSNSFTVKLTSSLADSSYIASVDLSTDCSAMDTSGNR